MTDNGPGGPSALSGYQAVERGNRHAGGAQECLQSGLG